MDKIISKSLSLSLFAMPALAVTVYHGANIAALIMLLLSILLLINRYPIDLKMNNKEKILIFALIFLPAIIFFDVLIRDLRFRYFDFYLRFILVIPVYFAIREIKVDIRPLFYGLLVGAIGAGLLAAYQKIYLQNYHAQGHIFKINFGNISLILAMMSIAGCLIIEHMGNKKILYILLLTAFISGVIGSIFTGVRGGWIAIPYFIWLLLKYLPFSRHIKIISVFILVLSLVATYCTSQYVQDRIDSTVTNVSAYFDEQSVAAAQTSAGSRLEMWKAGWLMFKEHPVFGIGSGEFRQAIEKKMASGEIKTMHVYDHVHNEPLHILIITGLIGFVGYVVLFGGSLYFFHSSLRSSQSEVVTYLGVLGMVLVGGFLIFGMTNYSFGHHIMVLFFTVMLVMLAALISRSELDANNMDITL